MGSAYERTTNPSGKEYWITARMNRFFRMAMSITLSAFLSLRTIITTIFFSVLAINASVWSRYTSARR